MALKETFLSYVELQRNANSMRESHGADDPKTVDAYQRANEVKRTVLDMIDSLERK